MSRAEKRAKTIEQKAKQALTNAENRARGSSFEKTLKDRGPLFGVQVVRIPEGARRIGPTHLVAVKSPFDFMMRYGPALALVDTKSTVAPRLGISALPEHQLDAMRALHVGFGQCVCGFLVNFVKLGVVEFFSIRMCIKGTSLKAGEGLRLGTSNDFQLRPLFQPRCK